MATKILSLEGLNDRKLGDLLCQLVETLPGVESAAVDYFAGRMTLEIGGVDSAQVVAQVVDTLRASVPEVTVGLLEVGADSPRQEPAPMPDRHQQVEYLEEDEEDEDADSGEEEPEERVEDQEQRPRHHRPPSPQLITGLVGLVAGGIFLGVAGTVEKGGLLAFLLALAAFCCGAACFVAVKPSHRHQSSPAATLLTVAAAGMMIVAGSYREAALTMVVALGCKLALVFLYDLFDGKMEELVDVCPRLVTKMVGSVVSQVPPDQVSPGDLVIVDPFTTIPLDGMVVEGKSRVEGSPLLGGGVRETDTGTMVFCGDYNLDDVVVVEVAERQAQAPVYRVRQLVLDAPVEHTEAALTVSKWAAIFTAVVVAGAVVAALVSAGSAYFPQWLVAGAVVLLLASPCGLAAVVHDAHLSGMARALKGGVVITTARVLELLWDVRTVVTGFRGLLTQGKYWVTGVRTTEGTREGELVAAAAAVEKGCEHPVAQAIVQYHDQMTGEEPPEAALQEELRGYGVRGVLDQTLVLVGSARFMEDAGVEVTPDNSGESCVYVSTHGSYVGKLMLGDPLRDGAQEMVQELAALGVKTAMLTGCDEAVALAHGKELGMDQVFPQLSLNDKLAQLEELAGKEDDPKRLLYAGGTDEVELFANPGINMVLGSTAVQRMLGIGDILVPSGQVEQIPGALQMAGWTKTAILACFGSFFAAKGGLLLWAVLRGMPLWAAALGNGLLSLLLVGICVGTFYRGSK